MRLALQQIAVAALFSSLSAYAADLTLDDAVTQIGSQVGDRVLRATSEIAPDGRDVFHVRLIDANGRMYTLEVDAESGDMREIATGPLVLPRGAPPPDEAAKPKSVSQEQDPCAS